MYSETDSPQSNVAADQAFPLQCPTHPQTSPVFKSVMQASQCTLKYLAKQLETGITLRPNKHMWHNIHELPACVHENILQQQKEKKLTEYMQSLIRRSSSSRTFEMFSCCINKSYGKTYTNITDAQWKSRLPQTILMLK
jgi:hypothetical protein